MSSPCPSCHSQKTVPLGGSFFCLACGGSGSSDRVFSDIRPEMEARLRAPVPEDEPEKVIIDLLEEVWTTAYAAGALVAAKSVRSEILSRPGRLRRLRDLWPLTTETEDEFRELLFFGAAE
jgi:hypothetical protein